MPRPWTVIESIDTSEGPLQLRQRDARDFLITVGGRVLMSSLAHSSELVLGQLGCEVARSRPRARVMVGGLGMGYTVKGAIDVLQGDAELTVVELNPVVERWCRGPMSHLCDAVLDDPRVRVVIDDVASAVKKAEPKSYDAIILDLYEGPNSANDPHRDPFYGSRAIASFKAALKDKGVLAVWSEQSDRGYENRLKKAGFKARYVRPGQGGLRYALYLAEA